MHVLDDVANTGRQCVGYCGEHGMAHHVAVVDLRGFKLSVGLTSQVYHLGTEGLFTQGLRPGRTVGGSVGGIYEMYCSDWSNGIHYQVFDTRPDTEFKIIYMTLVLPWGSARDN
jgi:hypothetical protein